VSYRRTVPTVALVMSPVVHIVERWLEEDPTAPRKQRHTATRIWERLHAEHVFQGAESTVRQWVREHRPARIRAVTLPLAHDPGAEAQFDFGEAHVRLCGVETTVPATCWYDNPSQLGRFRQGRFIPCQEFVRPAERRRLPRPPLHPRGGPREGARRGPGRQLPPALPGPCPRRRRPR
jgi:hypothetical protein